MARLLLPVHQVQNWKKAASYCPALMIAVASRVRLAVEQPAISCLT